MTRSTTGRAVALVAIGVAAVVLSVTPTAASNDERRVSVHVVGGGPVFDFDGLYPGATETTDVEITNQGPRPAAVTLDAIDVSSRSVCSSAEERAALPCGSGPGVLGEQLVFGIEQVAGDGTTVVWSGPIDRLAAVDLTEVPLAPSTTSTYRFTAHLPASSGNESQRDQLGFGLRFNLRELPGRPAASFDVIGSKGGERRMQLLGLDFPPPSPLPSLTLIAGLAIALERLVATRIVRAFRARRAGTGGCS